MVPEYVEQAGVYRNPETKKFMGTAEAESILEALNNQSALLKEIDENTEEKYSLKEFDINSFTRSFKVSDKINTEKINAIYKNGVLQLTVPKKEEAIEKPAREIKIS